MVTPGQSVLTVEDTRSFRLEVRLDESRAALVKVGTPAKVFLTTPGRSIGADPTSDVRVDATVGEVSRMLSSESHDFLIKIDLPSAGQLRSGMYGTARFQGPTRRAIAVPASAVVRRGQLTFVYVAEHDNRAHLRLVNAGEGVDGVVEIRSGLLEGDRVVSAPPPAMVDGSPITVGVRR